MTTIFAEHRFLLFGDQLDNQASDINSNYPNGATNGVVSWTPTAAGTYYYQCSVHDGMYGTITVQ